MHKLNKPTASVEDDEDAMFDLIDDFCLVADKSAKRVSANEMRQSQLFLGASYLVDTKCFGSSELHRGRIIDKPVVVFAADHVLNDDKC